MYELLTLRPAFQEADRARLLQRIAREEPPRPRQIRPEIPRDLQCFLEDRPIQARRATAAERLWRWCRRNPVVAGLLGTAALLLLLVAVTASVGYARTASALAGERTQRRRAEAATDVAIDVLDRIYERCAPPDFGSPRDATLWGADGDRAAKPALSEGTAAMLEDLLVFYDRLAESAGRDVQYREQVALANRRIGGIRHHLRQWEQAQAAYQRALETYQQIDQTSGVRPHVLEIALICNELGILDGHLGRPTGRASGSRKHWTCCRRPSATSTARRSRRSGPRWLVASGS